MSFIGATDGTNPVGRKIFKSGSDTDPSNRISGGGIINITANVALVFVHGYYDLLSSFKFKARLKLYLYL